MVGWWTISEGNLRGASEEVMDRYVIKMKGLNT